PALPAYDQTPSGGRCCGKPLIRPRHRIPAAFRRPRFSFPSAVPLHRSGIQKDCIVITPQNTRELWGCIEGMSVTYINQRNVKAWLKNFPGALNDTGDIPVIKRGR
ncbi:hypothetical protein ZK68_004744, partial [Salmonella enterica subsp. enterica]|nr:hypothetical protein [Salmonella enterica subsp. enterica]